MMSIQPVHPCFHRIHSDETPLISDAYYQLKMTISIDRLITLLSALDQRNLQLGSTSYVTFDDGWADVRIIPEDFFTSHVTLQPVIFLTDEQLFGSRNWMPLHALYRWMFENDFSLNDIEKLGINRTYLKNLREDEQYNFLNSKGIQMESNAPYLTSHELHHLVENGWLIGSHGPEHSDLRKIPKDELKVLLQNTLLKLNQLNFEPWIAWPEGRWNNQISMIARNIGFTRKFGLIDEPHPPSSNGTILRKLWS